MKHNQLEEYAWYWQKSLGITVYKYPWENLMSVHLSFQTDVMLLCDSWCKVIILRIKVVFLIFCPILFRFYYFLFIHYTGNGSHNITAML